jgi:hypothetical protein
VAFFAAYFERRPSTGYILAIALCGGALFAGYMELRTTRFKNLLDLRRVEKIQALKGLPLATDDPWLYLLLHYYGSPDFNSRLTYLTAITEDHADRCVQKLKPWVSRQNPLRIEEYSDFVATHSRFFLCFGASGAGGSLIQRRDSVRLRFEIKDTINVSICQASPAEGSDDSPPAEVRKTAGAAPR